MNNIKTFKLSSGEELVLLKRNDEEDVLLEVIYYCENDVVVSFASSYTNMEDRELDFRNFTQEQAESFQDIGVEAIESGKEHIVFSVDMNNQKTVH
jgi:hypothetical protein